MKSNRYDGNYGLLKSAIRGGCVEEAMSLLHNGALVNSNQNDERYTAFHFAVKEGYTELVEILIKKNVCIDARNCHYQTALHIATTKGHKNIVRLLLNGGANFNMKDGSGKDPLSIACKRGFVEIIRLLLSFKAQNECPNPQLLNLALLTEPKNGIEEVITSLLNAGANPNVIIKPYSTNLGRFEELFGSSPLHLACENGYTGIVKLFLKHEAQVNCSRLKDGYKPVHIAAQNGCTELFHILLNTGADVNATADSDITPLHLAVGKSNFEVVELLLSNGANVNAQTIDGSTPLMLAIKLGGSGSSRLINCLLKYKPYIDDKTKKSIIHSVIRPYENRAAVDYLLEQGFTLDEEEMEDSKLLPAAVNKGFTKIVQCILDHGANPNDAKYGSILLHHAVEKERKEIFKLLLSSGCDTNTVDERGNTPICYTLNYGADDECMEIIQLLIANGADVKMASKLLHEAIDNNFFEVSKFLIENGTDINALNGYPIAPLHLAVWKGLKEIVLTLLEFGADVNVCDIDKSTPLHFAGEHGRKEIAHILCSNQANVNAQNKEGLTPLHLACKHGCAKVVHILCSNHANINAQNKVGSTPLHLACKYGHEKIVVYLCSKKANVNAELESGLTPLHFATGSGCLNSVITLLNNRANPNAYKTEDGLGPLHIAAQSGSIGIIEMLLKFGADIDAQGCENETALHLAVSKRKESAVICLLDNGCDINVENEQYQTALELAISKKESLSSLGEDNRYYNRRYDYYGCKLADYERIIKILKEHLTKLITAGLFVHTKLLDMAKNGEFHLKWKEEVQKMKNEKVCCHFTLHDILLNRNNPKFARNESLMQTLKSYDYSKYPLYGNLIQTSIKNSKVRNELLASSQKSLGVLVKTCSVLSDNKSPILSDDILENIVPYLSNKDLRNLILCSESLKKQVNK